MSPAWGNVVGVIILLLMLVFIGVWLWAWSPHHRANFEELARLPMNDDAPSGDGVRAHRAAFSRDR